MNKYHLKAHPPRRELRYFLAALSMAALSIVLLLSLVFPRGQSKQQHQEIQIYNRPLLGKNPLPAILIQTDTKTPRPAVVLLHGCAGLSAKHEQWATLLNQWGYTSLLPDSFSARKLKTLCSSDDKLWQQFNRLRLRDALAALQYVQNLKQVDKQRVALIGWSYGGTLTLSILMNKQPGFKAGVAIYPSCWHLQHDLMAGGNYQPKVPVQILTGAADNWTQASHCQELVDNSTGLFKPTLHIYPDTLHNFDDPQQRYQQLKQVRFESKLKPNQDVNLEYNQKAHQKAKQDLKAFLQRHL